jgi:hypothetical protein
MAIGVAAWAQAPSPATRDGARDFDWEIGAWKTHVKRLQRPLTGSTSWVDYDGTTVVRGVLGNRANIAELSISGPAGRIEGAALRLYEPDTRRWTINYFSLGDGRLTPPLSGEFRDGVGTFHGDDTLGTRPIKVRFVISPLAVDTWRFEQAFSADEGKTWEVNWVATDKPLPGPPPVPLH